MYKVLNYLLVVLVVLSLSEELQAATVRPPKQEENMVQIEVVGNIEQYKKSNFSSQLQKLNKTVLYTYGKRTNGDKRLFAIDGTHYSAKSTTISQVSFPGNGSTVITSVQFRSEGNANVYVVEGGIGHHFISFVAEAPKNETDFSLSTEIFGKA